MKNTEEKLVVLQKLENKKEACVMQITDDLKTKLEMVRKVLCLGEEISYEELIHKMAETIFSNAERPVPTQVNKVAHSTNRYVPKAIKEAVFIRDRGRCSYISSVTGKKCSETKQLQ